MSMSNPNPPREGGNVWSAGSRGSRGGFDRSENENSGRGGGSYRNSYPRRGGGGYGFQRQNDNNEEEEEQMEILRDTIFVQNLPRNINRDDILDAFSSVGPVKTDDRSGGPKIWIYKDRMTGEGNGRATVTYEDEETAEKAIAEYNDQHISSIDAVVRVQLAQRRIRNNDNYRGFRGGRNNWHSRPGGNRWNNSRGGGGGGFRGRGTGDRGGGGGGGFYRGNSFRGNSRGGFPS